MNKLRFFQKLAEITPLSQELQSLLEKGILVEKYKAHQVLYATGQPDLRIGFIVNGTARNYYFDADGKEHTTRFWMEEQIIFSYEGVKGNPAVEYLEVLEATTLLTLTYLQLNDLHLKFNEIGLIINFIDQQYRNEELIRDRLLAMIPDERYRLFRKKNPQIFRKAPLRIIASYLNMTREGLSRIISRN